MTSDDSGKQSYRDLLISGFENLRDTVHDDIKELRNDIAAERAARNAAEKTAENRITSLETTLKYYAGGFSLLGGAVVTVISKLLKF